MTLETNALESHYHDGVLSLTLNRPEQANALTPQLVEALLTALDREDIRLCIIRGKGKHFCAGFDFSDIDNLNDADILWRFLRIETLLQTIASASFPTIALAQGACIGAGAELFAACWQRVSCKNTRLRFPGWNFELALGSRRLSGLVGQDQARDLLIDTRTIEQEELLSLGLSTHRYEPEHWSAHIDTTWSRVQSLSAQATQQMFLLTMSHSREEDIAAIVSSCCRPGLKERVLAYRDKTLL